MSDPNNPYNAPQSAFTDHEPLPQDDSPVYNLASRGSRLGAAIMDGIFGMMISFPLMFLALEFYGSGGSMFSSSNLKLMDTFNFKVILVVIGIVMYLILHSYFLVKNAQTIGKKIVGIKIVRVNGINASFSRIMLARVLPIQLVANIPVVGPLLSLVDVLLIFRSDQRCLHDLIANTMVVHSE